MSASATCWKRIVVPADGLAEADEIEKWFSDAGAVAISVYPDPETPLLENPGEETGTRLKAATIAALFSIRDDATAIASSFSDCFESCRRPRVESLAECDWTEQWHQGGPIEIGEKIRVLPRASKSADDRRACIRLDAGMAFGTGRHETTRLCLEALESDDLDEWTVLDYGCGSGILAIAAGLLGAGRCVGVDIDESALVIARDNANFNRVAVDFCTPSVAHEKFAEGSVDLVCANILLTTLTGLRDEFARVLRDGGRVLMSGVLESQAAGCLAVYEPLFNMGPVICKGDWALLSGTRIRR